MSLERLRVGVTYLPAETGIHLWQALQLGHVASDLARLRAAGLDQLRLHLAWDAFMPSHRAVDRHRLGELGRVLETADSLGIGVVVVLFAQSFGDCLLLPRWAVDRRRPRHGVRVLCEGRVLAGGPRDLYADPLMLEVAELWLRSLLDAYANHPAISAWDLGHDPASTLRPRRIAELRDFVTLMAEAVRRRQDPVMLTLGADDVLTARGVRPATLSGHLDRLGLAVDPQKLPLPGAGGLVDPAAIAWLLAVTARLAGMSGRVPPIDLVVGLPVAAPGDLDDGEREAGSGPASGPPPDWQGRLLSPADGARLTSQILPRLCEGGAGGLIAPAWTTLTGAALGAAPLDRNPWLARLGLATPDGALRGHAAAWVELAAAEREAPAQPVSWPATLDERDWYAALPESAADLFAQWRAENEAAPRS